MTKSKEEKSEFRSRDRWLLAALIVPPVMALSHLTVSYVLVPTACARRSDAMLHLLTLGFLVVTLFAGFIARRIHSDLDGADHSVLWVQRTRWFAVMAGVMALASAMVIIALEIPNLILRSCD